MKKLILLLASGLIIGLMSTSCGASSRVPDLIYPEEGKILTCQTPTFEWITEEAVDTSNINISIGNQVLVLFDEYTAETFYSIPASIFAGLPPEKYYWRVTATYEDMVYPSEVHSFKIEHEVPDIDLDTTYFPLAEGYKWVYEELINGDTYDTNSIKVISVSDNNGLLSYKFESTELHEFEYDLSLFNTSVFGNVIYYDRNRAGFVTGSGDTLFNHSSRISGSGWDEVHFYYSSTRLKGVGLIQQKKEWNWYNAGGYDIDEDRLVYFIKGQDTVWRCDLCP